MHDDVGRVIIAERTLAQRVAKLADEIVPVYSGADAGITIVPVLAGSMIFVSDLIRRLPIRVRIGLVTISNYRGKATSAQGARLESSLIPDLRNRDVLIVDDILETGGTLRLVQAEVRRARPRSVKTVVLLRKKAKAPPDVEVDFVGFDIEDVFVVGYGLDFDGLYRNLPYVAVLDSGRHEPEDRS